MRRISCAIIFVVIAAALAVGQTTLFINEFLASNTTVLADEAGEYDDWIEIYNAGDAEVNLAGYHLSDDPQNLKKWTFPSTTIRAKGYVLVWADGDLGQGPLHAGFKLAKSGEWLGLIEPGLTVIDSLSFGQQTTNISYGRTPDGGDHFIFINPPTPNAANPDALGIAASPSISAPTGVYASAQTVVLSTSHENADIYYTLDGSEPGTQADGVTRLYSSPITVSRTTVIRARVVAENYLPGSVATSAIFINPPHDLPIISIVTDPANLFSDDKGIYKNWNESGREWERGVIVSLLEDEQVKFSLPCGIRIQGNSGREMDKKSFRLYFRDSYGAPQLHYPLYDLTKVDKFKNLVLRAGYDDDLQKPYGTLLRDPVVTELFRRLGDPTSHSRFCVLYLNNEYWGIYDLKESVNEYFFRDYYNITDFDVVRMRWGYNNYELDYGDLAEWEAFLGFVRQNSFTDDAMYAQLAARIDVVNFTNLLALAHVTQYRSWVYGVFWIREKTPEAKWMTTIWDADRALGNMKWNGFTYYRNPSSQYYIYVVGQKLLQNPGYRRYFVNRMCDLYNTTFKTEAVLGVIDSLASEIESEIPRAAQRWGGSVENWVDKVEYLRQFVRVRPDSVHARMQRFFNLSAPATINIRLNPEQGAVQLNSVIIKQNFSGDYYPEMPIRLSAIPAAGYRFVGWADASLPQRQSIDATPQSGRTFEPLFEPLKTQIVVNEIMYAEADDWPCGDWIELYNPSSAAVDMSGWRISDDDSTHRFFLPAGSMIPARGWLVVSRIPDAFQKYYPNVTNMVGGFDFGWDGNDKVRLYDAEGNFVDVVAYRSKRPWDAAAANGDASLALKAPDVDNSLPENWAAEAGYGSPGRENFSTSDVRRRDGAGLAGFRVWQSYPNPFNNATTISFRIPINIHVNIKIYDILGRMVDELLDADMEAGVYDVHWAPTDAASGVYLCRITAGDRTTLQKLVLQK